MYRRLWMTAIMATFGIGLLALDPAFAAGRAAAGGGGGGFGGRLGLDKDTCKAVGGEVGYPGDGVWSCCLDDQCWNCRGEVPGGDARKHCDCYGDGCDDAAIGGAARRHTIGGLSIVPGQNAAGGNGPTADPRVRRPVQRRFEGGSLMRR